MGSVNTAEKIVKVTLGKFACASIEARFRGDPDSGVRAALLHYTRRLKSSRQPVGLPPFRFEDGRGEVGRTFDLALALEIQKVLEGEAERNRVPLNDLLTHAVLVYLADMDAAGGVGPAVDTSPKMASSGAPLA